MQVSNPISAVHAFLLLLIASSAKAFGNWREGIIKLGKAILVWCINAACLVSLLPAIASAQDRALPDPLHDPLRMQTNSDPILTLADYKVSFSVFRDYIETALANSAILQESGFGIEEQEAARREARSALFPVIDLSISESRALARNFSNDPDSIIERARGNGRADASANVQQMLFDFGATNRRIEGAAARIESAKANHARTAESDALRAIGSWYDVVAYRYMVALATTFLDNQQELRTALDMRIKQGVSAPVDRARVQSAEANARIQLATFKRQLGDAKARFFETFHVDSTEDMGRAPTLPLTQFSRESVIANAEHSSAVRAAEASARAARSDARASHADMLPTLTGGIEAGRYGLLEQGRNDYDVRARVTLRHRLLGPGQARADQASAKSSAQQARAVSVRDQAIREASVAWSELQGLQETLSAQRTDYLASRITRDATIERFRVSRGSLFDVLDAEQRYFSAAATYIRLLSEHDAALFVVLARADALLPALGIDPQNLRTKH
jgi:outer membrane protein, adhesin transport system